MGDQLRPRKAANPIKSHPPIIYFIGRDEYPLVKIGTTTNAKSRISSIRCGCPERVKILAYMPGDREVEKSIHAAFAPSHRNGEWFSWTPELVEYVVKNAAFPVRLRVPVKKMIPIESIRKAGERTEEYTEILRTLVTKSEKRSIAAKALAGDTTESALVRHRLGLPAVTRGRPPRPKPAKAKRPAP